MVGPMIADGTRSVAKGDGVRRWMLPLGVTAMLLALSACGPAGTPETTQPGAAVPSLPIEALTPEAKRATIATSFPAEVPVPVGDFTRAQAQGDDAWDYEVEVAAKPADVERWYREAYTGREWILVKEGDFDAVDGGGTFFEFRKNNAESSVNVYGDDSLGYTRIRVTVGVGAPVLQTQ